MNFNKSPAAWAGIIQAAMALVAVYVPNLPQAAILAIIGAATGLSFHSQKVENQKTHSALWTDPEDSE